MPGLVLARAAGLDLVFAVGAADPATVKLTYLLAGFSSSFS
jgi:hypothetical protein